MTTRVLILVLSSHVPPYDRLHAVQRQTWDSVAVDGVETQYYFCDTWAETYSKFGPALDLALTGNWTHLFRTNSSSYVCKRKLREFCSTLPVEHCFCGISGEFRGVPYTSGSGTILSRDAVHVLREALRHPPRIPGEKKLLEGQCEDVFIGVALGARGIRITPGAQRFDYWATEHRGPLPDIYHYRCAGSHPDGSRADFEAFDAIHAMKLHLQAQRA